MTVSLNQTIHQATDNRWFPIRFMDSFKTLARKGSLLTSLGGAIAATAAKVYTCTAVWYLMEGSIRSFMEVETDERPIIRLRPLGDAGGWILLAMGASIALGTLFVQIAREGEYRKLKTICKNWLKENRNGVLEDAAAQADLYSDLLNTIESFSKLTLSSKSLVSQRTMALKIYLKSEIPPSGKQIRKDMKLIQIFHEIQSQMDQKMRLSKLLSRDWEGYKIICHKHGCTGLASAILTGNVLPIIAISTAGSSYTGLVGLVKEVVIDEEELPDRGHVGEWMLNAIEAAALAGYLHYWCITNAGDFAIIRKIYEKQLAILNKEEDSEPYNTLRKLAEAELGSLSAASQYANLYLDYKFEKKECRKKAVEPGLS